jgi:hypothetical protein
LWVDADAEVERVAWCPEASSEVSESAFSLSENVEDSDAVGDARAGSSSGFGDDALMIFNFTSLEDCREKGLSVKAPGDEFRESSCPSVCEPTEGRGEENPAS